MANKTSLYSIVAPRTFPERKNPKRNLPKRKNPEWQQSWRELCPEVRLSQDRMPIEPLTQQQSWVRGKRPFPPPPANLYQYFAELFFFKLYCPKSHSTAKLDLKIGRENEP